MLKALAALLKAQGRTLRDPAQRKGLHPLVLPLADAPSGGVLGLIRWPASGSSLTVVEALPGSHSLVPLGTPSQYGRRAAAHADAHGDSALPDLVSAAADLARDAGDPVYEVGAFAASKLRFDQFLLLKVSPCFPDVWAGLARARLVAGDETAALIASERAASHNAGWGCCMWEQACMFAEVKRHEEQRDCALAALEAPFWSLGAPVAEVQAAAGLSHVPQLRALLRSMEATASAKQGEPPPSEAEQARVAAFDALDEVVRVQGDWDAVRPQVAKALHIAGLTDSAVVAEGGGRLYPWPVGNQDSPES